MLLRAVIHCANYIRNKQTAKMVAQLLVLKEYDNLSRRSSTYVDPETSDKFFEIPITFQSDENGTTTKCVNCFQISGEYINTTINKIYFHNGTITLSCIAHCPEIFGF